MSSETANIKSRPSILEPAEYGRWRNSRLGSLTESIEQRAIAALCCSLPGRRFLDLGCGDGAYALLASSHGAFVVGLDISSAMLTAGRKRAAARGAIVEWCQASTTGLPFPANTFDVVTAVTVLCFSEDPTPALREAARVLRPGGSLVIGELGKYSWWAVFRRVRAWLGSRRWSRARFWSVRELRRVVERAGLRFETIRCCVYYPPSGFLAEILSPLDPPLERLGQLGAAFMAIKATKP